MASSPLAPTTVEAARTPVERTQLTIGDTRRRDLVLAAYHLIAEKGFEGLRTRDVARRAAVNNATLYYYFPTKQGLIQGVVEYLVQQFVTIQGPARLMDTKTPLDALRQHFADIIYKLHYAPDIFRVIAELWVRAKRDPAILAILQENDEQWRQHLVTLLEQGTQQGVFRADLHPQRAAHTMVVLMKGLTLQMNNEPAELEPVLQDLESWLTGSSPNP